MFENEETTQPENEAPKVIKGEDGTFTVNGKHFKDIDALLESKIHADSHIETVQLENKALAEQNRSLAAQAELISTLQAKLDRWKEPGEAPTPAPTGLPKARDPEGPKAVDPQVADLQKQIAGLSTQLELDKAQAAENTVRQKLIDELGKEGAIRAWNNYTSSQEYDKQQYAQDLLKRPNSVIAVIKGFSTPASGFSPAGGSRPGPGGSSTQRQPKPWSYYKKLLLEKPKEYYSPEVSRQLRADKDAMGKEKFMQS